MANRITRLASSAVLQLGALVLAHQLVYLARYGSRFGEALVHAGHGDAWSAAVLSAICLAFGLAALGLGRLVQLGVLVRGRQADAEARAGDALALKNLVRTWLTLAPRIALLSLVLLTIQENVERASIGLSMPGPGILFAPEYAGAAWITIAVAAAVSLVAALFEWRRSVLLARLRAGRAPFARRSAGVRRPSPRLAFPIESLLGRRSALRAPPHVAVPT